MEIEALIATQPRKYICLRLNGWTSYNSEVECKSVRAKGHYFGA